MKHVVVPYSVKSESLEKVKIIIRKFIFDIEKNEPKTLYYKSFQQTDEPTKFIHIMTFLNKKAEDYHKNTKYCREFTDALYSLYEKMPTPINYSEIN